VSVFVGRFRCGLQLFWWKKSPFQRIEQIWKIVARWRYDWCQNGQESFQNLRKWAHHLVLPQPFTPYIVDVHPYKNILLSHYRVGYHKKIVKFVAVVLKTVGTTTICAHLFVLVFYARMGRDLCYSDSICECQIANLGCDSCLFDDWSGSSRPRLSGWDGRLSQGSQICRLTDSSLHFPADRSGTTGSDQWVCMHMFGRHELANFCSEWQRQGP